jgi:hypothetical protein
VRSNTPLQALTLLNDQAFLELARELARRVLAEGGPSVREQVRHAFRLCLAREPSPSETRRLEQYLTQQRQEFQAAPQEARALLAEETSPAALPERAAWTALARVLLNLDEFITRE